MNGRSASFKNNTELSEIIMEINDLRELVLDSDRPKQNRCGFNFSPLATDPFFQMSMSERRGAL